jgi:CRP-like cAMP-binding protein
MPKPIQYRSGSLIYFQGDTADKIFILQNGKVSLVYQDIETGEDVRDPVQPGEFFGVKSAMGRFPREENAIALSDTTIMAFTVPEFEAVAAANSRIIMKMLKVFSNQLRRIHKQVSKLMASEEDLPADGLFNTGEYYLKNKRFAQAKHVFGRYLTFYPTGKDALQASKNLEIAENSLVRHGNAASAAMPVKRDSSAGPRPETANAYYDAVSLVSQEKYQEAFVAFKSIVDANADPEWTARSSFEIGRCMFLLKKYEDCLRYYTTMLTQYPKHPEIKDAMFIMGQCNEKIGRKDQAAAFYKKILSMSPGEDDGTTTKVKRALGALGA